MPDAYETQEIDPGIHRISLEMAGQLPEPVSGARNIYLLDGEAPALVNAGHPSQLQSLSKALHSLDVDVTDIQRVLYTSWSIDILGGAKNFPGIDHFVYSPDMVRPRHYQSIVGQRRRRLFDFADDLLERDAFSDENRSDLEAFAEDYFLPVPSKLDFVPVRAGHVVRAGDFKLEVIASPGPDSGHVCFWEADREILFTGDISLSGLPHRLEDVQSYFVSLERLIEFESDRVLPNRGRPRKRGSWTLQGAHRFINNFMSNAPQAMYEDPTLIEFAERDWGERPDDFAETVLKMEIYRALMEELVRSKMIEAEGSGLDRRYGTDVDDPRETIRKI